MRESNDSMRKENEGVKDEKRRWELEMNELQQNVIVYSFSFSYFDTLVKLDDEL